jgi:hypothetical protein
MGKPSKAEIVLDVADGLWRVSILDEHDDEVSNGNFETAFEATDFAGTELE